LGRKFGNIKKKQYLCAQIRVIAVDDNGGTDASNQNPLFNRLKTQKPMKTNFFMWLLRKLKIPHQSVGTPNQVCNDPFMEPHGTDSDPFLLTHKHSERECRQKIQEALLYGKDKLSRCRNLIKLDGEYINLSGCKNDKKRAEAINRYLPEQMPKIKGTDLAKARQNPRN